MAISTNVKRFIENNIQYLDNPDDLEIFFDNTNEELTYAECNELKDILQLVLEIPELREKSIIYIIKRIALAISDWQMSSSRNNKYEISIYVLFNEWYKGSPLWYTWSEIEGLVLSSNVKFDHFRIIKHSESYTHFAIIQRDF